MIAVISFFSILIISVIIVRVASIMLKLTGLSADVAKFQARSAFTGTGFTTREAEGIINHPVRRRIIQTLMLIGNIGVVSFISSVIISVLTLQISESGWMVLIVIGVGLLLLLLFTRSRLIEILFTAVVTRLLRRWTHLYTNDYDSLLNLQAEFEVTKFKLPGKSWFTDRAIKELKLTDEGILILAVRRTDGYFIGTPQSTTVLYEGDEVIMYGRAPILRSIITRPAGEDGDRAHREAVEAQLRMEGKETGTAKKPGILRGVRSLFGPRKKKR
ncbi:MAG: TrkA C-terminal domain-containing protein [Spirochaetales bacterium]|nr:TrkA C-terminal domain-containing protein [Spirochaetales bacterium]